MASLRERGENNWEITVYLYTNESGKRINHYETFYGSKTEAKSYARDLETSMKRSPAGPRKASMTLAEYLEKWLSDFKNEVTERTWVTCGWHVRRLIPVVGHLPVYSLTPPELRATLKNGFPDLAPRSVQKIYGTLRMAVRRAVADGLLVNDPTQALRSPRVPRKKRKVLDLEELVKMLEAAAGYKHHLVIRMMALTGMRLGEALGIKWDDVDLEKRTLSIVRSINTQKRRPKPEGDIAKTENSLRRIRLDEETARLLAELKTARLAENPEADIKGQYVFGRGDRPLGDYSVRRTLNGALKKAQLGHIRVHDLRHGVGSILVDGGENLAKAAALLGHTPETLMRIYTHPLRLGESLAGMLPQSDVGKDVGTTPKTQ